MDFRFSCAVRHNYLLWKVSTCGSDFVLPKKLLIAHCLPIYVLTTFLTSEVEAKYRLGLNIHRSRPDIYRPRLDIYRFRLDIVI